MAMVTMLLLALLIGIMEFGWLVKNSNTIVNASREGARFASLGRSSTLVRTRVINSCAPLKEGAVSDGGNDIQVTFHFFNEASSSWQTWGTGSATLDNGELNTVPVGSQIRVTVTAVNRGLTGFFPILRSRRLFQSTTMRREL
jgi:Flp pilus assembly protein TadG